MRERLCGTTVLLFALSLVNGCEMLNRYGVGVGSEPSQPQAQQAERLVDVWLDGKLAQPGKARCKIADPVSIGPKLKYEIVEPEKIGRVKSVMINVFREVGDGWSNSVDFIVISSDVNNPDAQMKPGVIYDLGAPGEALRVMDGNGNSLEGIKLESGVRYLMNFVVNADRSETVSVEFTAG